MNDDDPVALLAAYQEFIDRYRTYQRVLRLSCSPAMKNVNMDDEVWDALEAIDDVFDPLFERDDRVLDVTIAAMRLENERHSARTLRERWESSRPPEPVDGMTRD